MEKASKKSLVIAILITLIAQLTLPIFENVSYAIDVEDNIIGEDDNWSEDDWSDDDWSDDDFEEEESAVNVTLEGEDTLKITGEGEITSRLFLELEEETVDKIKKIIIEEGITSIAVGTFYYLINMESIELPSTLVSIGDNAFSNCQSLIAIEIPNGVETIGKWAFRGCSGLQTIKLPNTVKSIGDAAFSCCENLIEIEIPDKNITIGEKILDGSKIVKMIKKGEQVELPGILKSAQTEGNVFYSNKGLILQNCELKDGKIKIVEGKDKAKITIRAGKLKGFEYVLVHDEFNITENGSINGSITYEGILTISGTGAIEEYDLYQGPYSEIGEKINKIIIKEGITEIGDYVFGGLTNLTEVTIPNSVLKIGENSFAYCHNLDKMKLPSSIKQIGKEAFLGCEKILEITIPKNVENIGENAFGGCQSLQEIKVENGNSNYISKDGILYSKDEKIIIKYPAAKSIEELNINKGIEKIGNYAFSQCNNLRKVTIPDGVKEIGQEAFRYCENLETVELPETLITIESGAFSYCSIKEIIIPEQTQIIRGGAFYGCGLLETIRIPKNVKEIGEIAFKDCTSLREIEVDVANKNFKSIDGILYSSDEKTIIKYPEGYSGEEHNIRDGVEKIGNYSFSGSNLKKITIPKGVKTIGSSAFAGCYSLSTIVIANTVVEIEKNAFEWCTYLENITIPNSVKNIGEGAFAGCSSLTSIKIPANVEKIDNSAFDYCAKLQKIEVDAENQNYKDIDGVWYTKDGKTIIKYPAGKQEPKEYIIEDGVEEIGSNAFAQNEHLAKIVIPSGVKNIGYGAFNGCTNLQSIEIPTTVTKIESRAFSECEKLLSIKIPRTVIEIGYDIFDSYSDVNIICQKGSKAEKYAKDNWLSYTLEEGDELVIEGCEITEENYVLGISDKMKIEDFKSKIQNGEENKIYEVKGGKRVIAEGLIKTGQELEEDGVVYTLVVKGDVNGTGTVDLNDAIKVLQHLAGGENPKLTGADLKAAELKNAGKVTLNDVIKIMKYKATNGAEEL